MTANRAGVGVERPVGVVHVLGEPPHRLRQAVGGRHVILDEVAQERVAILLGEQLARVDEVADGAGRRLDLHRRRPTHPLDQSPKPLLIETGTDHVLGLGDDRPRLQPHRVGGEQPGIEPSPEVDLRDRLLDRGEVEADPLQDSEMDLVFPEPGLRVGDAHCLATICFPGQRQSEFPDSSIPFIIVTPCLQGGCDGCWRTGQGIAAVALPRKVARRPGQIAAGDFTVMNELNLTIAKSRFDHTLSHCVLTYSDVESVSPCTALGKQTSRRTCNPCASLLACPDLDSHASLSGIVF